MTDHYKNRGDCIFRTSDDKLSRKVYRLSLPWGLINHSSTIKLSEYAEQTRPTTRHAWTTVGYFPGDRWTRGKLERETITVPDDVVAEFLAVLTLRGVS